MSCLTYFYLTRFPTAKSEFQTRFETRSRYYHTVKFNSYSYTLQEGVIIDWRKVTMGEQVANYCYLSHTIQGYKWYVDNLYGKTHNGIVAMRILVHPQSYIDITDDLSKISTNICSWKVSRLLFQRRVFSYLLHHDMIVKKVYKER